MRAFTRSIIPFLSVIFIALGCLPDHGPAIKEVGESVKEAGKSAVEATKNVNIAVAKFGEDIKIASDKLDPIAIKQLLAEVKDLRAIAEKQKTQIEVLTDQILEKMPLSIVGEYRPRYLSKAWGPPSFVKYMDGTFKFRFFNNDEKNKFDKEFTWDKKRQLFVANDGQRAYFFPDAHLIVFDDFGHWFQPKPGEQ